MADINKLKNKARREEQRENWSRAIELYKKALLESEKERDGAADLSLFNRIGDIHLRLGDKRTAVQFYEQAIQRYADQDLHTSAIALCNKVLRILPDRVETLRQLGQLQAATGLAAEARGSYLRYAAEEIRQKRPDRALEALEECVEATADQEVGLRLAELFTELGRREEAVERLRSLVGRLEARGADAGRIEMRLAELEAAEDAGPGTAADLDPLAGLEAELEAAELPSGAAPEARETASDASERKPEVSEREPAEPEREGAEPREAAASAAAAGAPDDDTAVPGTGLHTPEPPPAFALPDDVAPFVRSARPAADGLEPGSDRVVRRGGPGGPVRRPGEVEAPDAPTPAPAGPRGRPAADPETGERLRAPRAPARRGVRGSPDGPEWEVAARAPAPAPAADRDLSEAGGAPDAADVRPIEAPGLDVAPPDGTLSGPSPAGTSAGRVDAEPVEPAAASPPEGSRARAGIAQPEPPASSDGSFNGRRRRRRWRRDPSEATGRPGGATVPEREIGRALEPPARGGHPRPDAPEAFGDVAAVRQPLVRERPELGGPPSATAAPGGPARERVESGTEVAGADAMARGAAARSEERWEDAIAAYEVALASPGHLEQALEALRACRAALADVARTEAEEAARAEAEEAAREAEEAARAEAEQAAREAEQAAWETEQAAREAEEAAQAEAAGATERALAATEPGAPAGEPEIAAEATPAPSVNEEEKPAEAAGSVPAEEAPAAPSVVPSARPDRTAPAGTAASSSTAESEDEAAEFEAWVRSVSPDLLQRAWRELEGRGEWKKATLVVAQLLRLEPGRTDLLRARAELAERLGDEGQPDAWRALGERLERSGQRDEAADAYRRLLAVDPVNEEGRAGLERVRGEPETGREEEAVQVRDKVSRPSAEGDAMRYPTGASIDPYDARPQDASASGGAAAEPPGDPTAGPGVATADGPVPYEGLAEDADPVDFDALLAELKTSLVDNDAVPDTRSRTEMGAELKEMGLLDEAIRELQAAVREPQAPAEAFELLGESFIEKGQPRIATRLLSKAVEERSFGDRESLGVLYQLGVAHQQLGERAEALECYERIFSVDIDYRDIKERILACSD